MQNTNSQIPKQPCLQKCIKASEILSGVFSVIGLICSLLILFIILTNSTLNLFDPITIANCQLNNKSTSSNYIYNASVLSKLVLVQTTIEIIIFAFFVLYSLFRIKMSQKAQSSILAIYRKVINVLLILAAVGLFGNCLKITLSLINLVSCANNSETIYNAFYGCQNLTLLSGICLLSSLVIFFMYPILLREIKQVKYRQQLSNLNQNKEKMIDYGLQIPEASMANMLPLSIELTVQKKSVQNLIQKPKRIFDRVFLAQSKYGVSNKPSTHNSVQKSYELNSQLISSPLKQSQINIRTDQSIPYNNQTENKGSKKKSSYLIDISEQGPPLQLGKFNPNFPTYKNNQNIDNLQKHAKD